MLEGGVVIREPDLLMQGVRAEVDLERETAVVHDAQFLLPGPELRGTAETVTRDEAGNVFLKRQVFTRSEPGNDSWRITARHVNLPEKAVFGTARHAVVRMKGVPVLYTPMSSSRSPATASPAFSFPTSSTPARTAWTCPFPIT